MAKSLSASGPEEAPGIRPAANAAHLVRQSAKSGMTFPTSAAGDSSANMIALRLLELQMDAFDEVLP